MLSLFRINDIPRILLLGIILVLIRLPFWLEAIPALKTIFEYRLLAEALSEDRLIYRDVWHYSSPLGSLILQAVGELFGRSFKAFQILGFLFLFLQAIYFNSILNRLDALKDRTLIPALFYIFFGSILVEQFALSQELLSIFPFLLLLSLILNQLRYGAKDKSFFSIGFVYALVLLFHGSFFWLLPFLLIYFPFVFVMNPKRFTLLITGILFPLISVLLYFYLREGAEGFINFYLKEIFLPYYYNYLSITQYVVLASIPLAFLLIGLFQTFIRSRFLNFQVSFNNFFLLLIPFSVPIVFFTSELSLKSFYVFIPLITFFAAQLYMNFKRRGINELIFSSLLILTVFVNFGFTYKKFFNPDAINIDKLNLNVDTDVRNKKLAVLDNKTSAWYDNTYAGPFFFYPYTERYFRGGLGADKIGYLHNYFLREKPEIIMDKHDYFEDFRNQNLIMREKYRKVSPSVFIRNN